MINEFAKVLFMIGIRLKGGVRKSDSSLSQGRDELTG